MEDEAGIGHIHRDAHDGRVVVCLDDLLVAQIETRSKEKINGNGGEKGGEDDGAGIHGSRGFFALNECIKNRNLFPVPG